MGACITVSNLYTGGRRFNTHLFACLEYSPTSLRLEYDTSALLPTLCTGRSYTRLLRTFASLLLLQRLKARGSRFLRPLTVHFRLDDRLRGDLQRHVFEQIMEYSWARNVSVVGNQSDGAGDVSVPRLGDLKELEDRVRRKQPLH